MDEPVLLTGAGGRVGQAVLEGLADEYEWKLLLTVRRTTSRITSIASAT
jgi:nucleoside-diphosphate-sugar epimerase